jgi:hypothetical protein
MSVATGNVDGNGCYECSGRRAINPLYQAGREHCMTCACYCTAWFPLDEAFAIAKYLWDDDEGVLAGDAPVVQTGTRQSRGRKQFLTFLTMTDVIGDLFDHLGETMLGHALAVVGDVSAGTINMPIQAMYRNRVFRRA